MPKIDNGVTVANTVYTSTFTQYMAAVEISNFGDVDLWARTDGTDPVIGADDTHRIPAGDSVVITNDGAKPKQGAAAVGTTVKLRSAKPVEFAVQEAN